mgnify:FL=1
MVFRALHGRAWVGASGRDTVGIEGSALFVWRVLDEAASADELTERIGELWPELGEIRVAEVQAAVDSLVDAQLIEAVEQAVAPAGLT